MTYTPTNWKRGDVVTSEKLNKLENGVASAESSAQSAYDKASQGGGSITPLCITYTGDVDSVSAASVDVDLPDAFDAFSAGIPVLIQMTQTKKNLLIDRAEIQFGKKYLYAYDGEKTLEFSYASENYWKCTSKPSNGLKLIDLSTIDNNSYRIALRARVLMEGFKQYKSIVLQSYNDPLFESRVIAWYSEAAGGPYHFLAYGRVTVNGTTETRLMDFVAASSDSNPTYTFPST